MSREAVSTGASWACAVAFAVLLVALVHAYDRVALGALAVMLAALGVLIARRAR